MRDGGEEDSNGERVDQNKPSKQVNTKEFGCEVAKVAMAQICECVGFDNLKESSLEAMTDITIRYICELGKAASFYANVANRTECNVFDVVQGLEDLGSSTGFSGTNRSECIVREIVEFVDTAEEIPFAQPVPHFPIMRNRAQTPSFSQIGEMPGSNHIPSWLPAFPDPHTYIHTPVWNERETDLRDDQIALARQRRKAERSLLSLQQQLAEASSNQFLSKPIQADKGETSSVSVLDTFSPALEEISNGTFGSYNNGKTFLSDERENVHLCFKSSKKIFGEPVDLRIRNRGSKAASCSGKIDERDDKKRRAQLILRLSKENPQELTLL